MTQRSRSGKKSRGWKLLFLLVVFIMIGYAVYYFVYDHLVDAAAEQVTASILAENGKDGAEASRILDSMSEGDREVVEEVIRKHADIETVKEAQEVFSNGGSEGLREFARNRLSAEDLRTLRELYRKYQ